VSPTDRPGGSSPDGDPIARAREYLLAERRGFLAGVLTPADGLDDPDADALRAALESRGLLERSPAVLGETVEAIGRELPHEPVAKPPYVVVTSAGLVLRAVFGDDRLVITVAAFEYRGGEWVRHATPEAALRVRHRD
jgi:hypothetical protein